MQEINYEQLWQDYCNSDEAKKYVPPNIIHETFNDIIEAIEEFEELEPEIDDPTNQGAYAMVNKIIEFQQKDSLVVNDPNVDWANFAKDIVQKFGFDKLLEAFEWIKNAQMSSTVNIPFLFGNFFFFFVGHFLFKFLTLLQFL